MKGKIIKEICVASGTIGFIILLTMSFGIIPALGNFLNPFGVWTVPGNAENHDMTITDSQLDGIVTVQIDNLGVPHIHATTDADLFFALGYVHASNRLFEMDMFRRASDGRLAEILGEDFVNTDKYFRILGFNRHAELATAYIQENDTASYNMLVNYSNGVNKFIDSITPWTLPLEYKLLSITPEPWSPYDTVVFKYLQAWDLSGDFSDLDNTLLQANIPANVYEELYPNSTMGEPFIPPIIQELTTLEEEEPSSLLKSILALRVLVEERLNIFGALTDVIGSNNWAVNGSKTPTGNPLLAGDPHLGYQQPSLWYEVHMVSDEGYNCTGVSFPAAPVIIIGHNDHIAWSLTNIGGDSHVDFYEEQVNDTHYYYDGAWVPLKLHTEVINLKDGSSETITVRETIHGPLITDHNIVRDLTGTGFSNISMKWTATHVELGENYSNEMKGLVLINKANNFTEFNEGLRWMGIMQNFVYADDKGNIAMTVSGPFPLRKQGVAGSPDGNLTGNVVQNGTGVGEEWAGFVPFNELPREVNPSRGWVGSANQLSINRVNNSYQYYIGENTFADGWRCRRIRELLEASNSFTMTDFKAMQGDNYAYSASQFLPILIDAWNYSINVQGITYDQTTVDVMNLLTTWNQTYMYYKNLTAPTIWDRWLPTFEFNTWNDEFSDWDTTGLRKPRITILENLTKFQPNSIWFNDTSKAGTQDRNHTMLKSLNETVAALQSMHGPISNWTWGLHHQIYVEHLTGMSVLSSPHIPLDGGGGILNNQWETGGPSMRIVIDLGNVTTSDTSSFIYPGGQSGNPASSHYLDLLYMYVEYQYHPVYRSTVPTAALEATWTFKP